MGRTVVVTGASGGIGGAVAALFARRGDAVVLGHHRNEAAATALCEALCAEGARAVAHRADVTDSAAVDGLFARAEEAFGPVEVLVTCAGTASQVQAQDITDQAWRQMLAVHADGTFFCCRRALPAMLRRRAGAIVALSSMWGQVGASCEVHYSAAKAAVIGLVRALAKEVGPSGVRVNCVAPGAVDTAMLAGFTAKERAAIAAEAPLGRLGTVQDIAEAAWFLASPAAAFITGQVLAPNGGMVV